MVALRFQRPLAVVVGGAREDGRDDGHNAQVRGGCHRGYQRHVVIITGPLCLHNSVRYHHNGHDGAPRWINLDDFFEITKLKFAIIVGIRQKQNSG